MPRSTVLFAAFFFFAVACGDDGGNDGGDPMVMGTDDGTDTEAARAAADRAEACAVDPMESCTLQVGSSFLGCCAEEAEGDLDAAVDCVAYDRISPEARAVIDHCWLNAWDIDLPRSDECKAAEDVCFEQP